jgi:hypothetical protein
MSQHLMIDLETLGTRPGAVVVEIGLVWFSAGDPCEHERVVRVDVQDALNHGLRVDAATLAWWMGQDDEARRALFNPDPLDTADHMNMPVSLRMAAHQVCDAISGMAPVGVWANGASFDLPILAEMLHRAHVPVPWDYRRERCFRTVNGLFPTVPKLPHGGVRHSAVDDAKYQAARLVQLNELHPAILGAA